MTASPLPLGRHSLGRDPDVAVRFDLPSVSRHHARITVTEEGATLEDLGSKNGTTVSGKALSAPVVLRDGDEIRFGSVHVVFREGTEARPTVTLDGS